MDANNPFVHVHAGPYTHDSELQLVDAATCLCFNIAV